MGGIQSWDDFEPEERDHFQDRHKKTTPETDNLGNLHDFQGSLGEPMKEIEGTRFAEVLTILIEKGIFQ